jgi:hypothetical protein
MILLAGFRGIIMQIHSVGIDLGKMTPKSRPDPAADCDRLAT